MSHPEFSLYDRDPKASTDESAPPPVPMAPISKPEFSTDSGGISGGSSGTASWRYKGVSHRANDKWVAQIRVPEVNKDKMGTKIWLGTYPTAFEAAFAYDVAVTCLGGRESMLNFHHPIYKQIPRISPDLSPLVFKTECRKVISELWKVAKVAGDSVSVTPVGKPKYSIDSGGGAGGLLRTFRECLDRCPECGKTFLASKSMLFHLMDHWKNQEFSRPPQSSRDSGRDSPSPGMDSRWWLMYKGVWYWEADAAQVERPLHIYNLENYGKWVASIELPNGINILLGLYSDMLEAAYAYDVAVTCLGGKPLLNFHGHPIYEQILRISLDLPLQVVATSLKKVVKEFGELAMEGGYYGIPKHENQEETVKDLLDMHSWKPTQDKDMLLNSVTQQGGDLDTFQENKRRRLSDNSGSNRGFLEDHSPYQSDDVTIKKLSEVQQRKWEMLGMLPPDSSINAPEISVDTCPRIEPANTRNKQTDQPVSPGHEMLSGSPDGALKFTMADLNIITGNFSESLSGGQGGSGSVYRGQLQDGTTVAVKRMKKVMRASEQHDKNVLDIEDAKDFQTEADTLFKEKHVNLVRLLGFLEDENELILVTEYVTNGNLRQHLDGVPHGVILDMSKRCWISLDVVSALKHLHDQTKDDLDIIHRNIKSTNVLITNDFRAKVAGFHLSPCNPFGDVGASSSCTLVKGTSKYMAREHLIAHHLKEQNDVYSFGELLVEIFTGKQLVESNLPSDECFTPKWVLKQCAEGRLMDIIDPKITPTPLNLKILEQIFKLADYCLGLKESNHSTMGYIFRYLSTIVRHYFGCLKDESNSKGDKYEVQKERKLDLEAFIERNIQTPCLEESKALKGQELTKCLDKIDSSNPSFMPTKPHGSLFVEVSKSIKIQTSIELGTQLEVDSKQASRQASELLVANQDQSSPLFNDIISDVFQWKSDEEYLEMLQEEIAKLDYISRLLNEGDDQEQNLTMTRKTNFFLYFNEKDNVFEFYFKNYQGMASIVGVGLECAKVILEDGWRVLVQEISKPEWDDAWKNFDSSSSTMKVTILDPLEEGMDNMEDSRETLPSIPKGQCLLLDLAQYFILKMAIASFLPRTSMMHATNGSGMSSSSSSQDIARSSSSSDKKSPIILQSLRNMFSSRKASTELKAMNGDGPPMDPLGKDDMKFDTTVHLKLLPGGDLYDGSNLLDATILDDELKTLTNQLDDTIYLEMDFKFVNENDMKEIQVIVGPISFQFQVKNEVNYKTTKRFGWYHKSLDVSFRPINTCESEIGPNHNALDIVKVKKTITIGSSDATTHGTSKSMNGGVQGKIPPFFKLHCEGNFGYSTTKSNSDNVCYAIEKEFEETRGGFAISSKRDIPSSTLEYAYFAPDYMHELDHEKLPSEDYRKYVLYPHPICNPQDIKFEGTWHPKGSENNPQEIAEYSLYTSREVHMTSKEISEKVDIKSCFSMICGHSRRQKERNEPLKYTQKYARSIFLNHAMTHLNGKKFRVEEVLSQRPLNERESETHLEDCSSFAPLWRANPLVGLNSKLHHQS